MSWIRRRRTPLLIQLVAVLVLSGAIWALYTSDGAVKSRERDARLAAAAGVDGPAAERLPARVVDVMTATRQTWGNEVELAGVLEPVRSTWVAAEVAGSIEEVLVPEHSFVEEGAVLVRLDAALPRAQWIRAQASYDLSRADLQRQQQLGTRSVASEAELDRARAEERRSYAALLEAETALADTSVLSPFAGLVNSLEYDPGAYVAPGTRIAELLDVETLELVLFVSDRQVGSIQVGDIAKVRVDAVGNEVVEGRVARKGSAPKASTQRYPIVLTLENTDRELLPGMLVRAMLQVGSSSAILLPARAVLREFELDYVFVVGPNGEARRVRIVSRPVPFRPDLVEVVEGLRDGDQVVSSGAAQLRDGLKVEARP